MRITIPAGKVSTLRTANVASLNVKLVERKLNQNPIYFVTCNGVAINFGGRKHAMRKFREYTIGYEVKALQA